MLSLPFTQLQLLESGGQMQPGIPSGLPAVDITLLELTSPMTTSTVTKLVIEPVQQAPHSADSRQQLHLLQGSGKQFAILVGLATVYIALLHLISTGSNSVIVNGQEAPHSASPRQQLQLLEGGGQPQPGTPPGLCGV